MKIRIISTILTIILTLALLCSCTPPTPQEPVLFTLRYSAGVGGIVQGEAEQTVEQGKDATAVTAVAASGYTFEKWSDDVTTTTRQDKTVQADITVIAQFKKGVIHKTTYIIQYHSTIGGTVQGELQQTVEQGKDATAVTAVANDGYEFDRWSDGVLTATRQDTNIYSNISATAIFQETGKSEPVSKTFSLNYNFGEADNKPEQLTVVENEPLNITLPIPTREHFTFQGKSLTNFL